MERLPPAIVLFESAALSTTAGNSLRTQAIIQGRASPGNVLLDKLEFTSTNGDATKASPWGEAVSEAD